MTINLNTTNAKRWLIAGIALASIVAYCAPPGTFRRIDFEFTGTVRDSETKEPLEGAYVVAIYTELESNFAVSSINCKKTKGMFTGKDGKFHFPVEKLDAHHPHDVTAIKPGYYGNDRIVPSIAVAREQRAEAYTNRDHFLTKQNPDKPDFRFGDFQEGCTHAEWREDIEASIQFQEIKLAELKRLSAESWRVRDTEQEIARLESLQSVTKRK